MSASEVWKTLSQVQMPTGHSNSDIQAWDQRSVSYHTYFGVVKAEPILNVMRSLKSENKQAGPRKEAPAVWPLQACGADQEKLGKGTGRTG